MIVQRLQKLQKKAVCLINFETNPYVVGQLLKDSNILKLTDFMKYKSALFIRNSLRKKNIPIFNEAYTLFTQNRVYNTRGSTNQMLVVPQMYNLTERLNVNSLYIDLFFLYFCIFIKPVCD